jgi:hypothetical protein
MFFLLCIFSSCKSREAVSDAGWVQLRLDIFPPSSKERGNDTSGFRSNIWYRDSLIIEESRSLHSKTDTSGITVNTTVVDFYRFYNLRTKTIYIFKKLSDTANPIDQHRFSDSSKYRIGGWGFDIDKNFEYIGKPEILPDSIENGRSAKRIQLRRKRYHWDAVSVLSYNCSVPAFFDMAPMFYSMTGCPCTSIYTYFTNDETAPSNISTFDFIRSHLLDNEKIIFDAWLKKTNARK